MKQITRKNDDYHCTYFLTALYMILMIGTSVLGPKLIVGPLGIFSAASLIAPLWFVVGDIIAEVYGFKMMLKIFWSTMTCQFIFSFLCYALIHLHSPIHWHGQASFDLVLGDLIRIAFFQLIGGSIAWYVNTKLLLRWKRLLLGKYFWLRSIGSSGIGLTIFSILSVTPLMLNINPLPVVISIVASSCLLKIFLTALLAGPSTLVINALKKIENLADDQSPHSFNPFETPSNCAK